MNVKPLGQKAYGHIPHLPQSRLGPSDHQANPGHVAIATEDTGSRDRIVIVQEKLDGSCVAVANVDGDIIALQRAGYLAKSSPYQQHHLFAEWVEVNRLRFRKILANGDRVVGEWLAQAHGTRYDLEQEPFVPFDIIRGRARLPYFDVAWRVNRIGLLTPATVHVGPAISVKGAMRRLGMYGYHGARDPIEGAVWRVERRDGTVEFLAKYVRPDKVDGCYLPEISGQTTVWNWLPDGWQSGDQAGEDVA